MTKQKLIKKELESKLSENLTNAYLSNNFGKYTNLFNMIYNIVPKGFYVKTTPQEIEVFVNTDDLNLYKEDKLSLEEGFILSIDDVHYKKVQ